MSLKEPTQQTTFRLLTLKEVMMLRADQANKRYFCQLCLNDRNKSGTKSKCYKSLFRLQFHVGFHHVDSIEKIAYKERLAKMRREDRS